MKKTTTIFAFVFTAFSSYAQNSPSNDILVRHDTTTLKAGECDWMIRPLSKTGQTGKSVPLIILEAIRNGKLKVFDPQTNEVIPGDKIFTWNQPSDTAMVWDAGKNDNIIKIIQHEINPDLLTRIRVYQDWYIIPATGKIESRIQKVDLLGEVRAPSTGDLIGYQSYCRVYY